MLLKILKKISEIIFPNHCISCSEIVSPDSLFCQDCFVKLQFISEPKCQICSYPFEVELKHLPPFCAKCLSKKPKYDQTLTVFRYNDTISKPLSDLKYCDSTFLAKKFARIFIANFKDEIANCDFICAVPLHVSRLKKRKFNQSILIAKNLDQKKFIPDLLWRLINTKSQVSLKKQQRQKNLKKAFLVNQKYRSKIKNKKILLIDDVITTGATVEGCSKALKKFGAKEVVVLAIAKSIIS